LQFDLTYLVKNFLPLPPGCQHGTQIGKPVFAGPEEAAARFALAPLAKFGVAADVVLLGGPENAGDGLAVLHLSAHDPLHGPGERDEFADDAFVVFRRCLAFAQIARGEQRHGFIHEAGSGVVAGLFGEFTLGGGERIFAFIDASGGQLPEFTVGGVAVLADEQDGGLGAALVDGEDDDGSWVADDFTADANAGGLDDLVADQGEDSRGVQDCGGENLHGLGGRAGG
jgi:hypothetical protein